MKKLILFSILSALAPAILAQNLTDGLRYSLDANEGTARFQAMSGAFGALGGDLSAVSLNPAGSAVFLNNKVSITGAFNDVENSSIYFGSPALSADTDVNISQGGGVFVFYNDYDNSPWQKFTLAVNYNVNRNLDNDLFVKGDGNTSIGSFFLQQAQGTELQLLDLQTGESISDLYNFLGETQGVRAQNAFLGYQGFIFDPVETTPGNTQYTSNFGTGSYDQEYYLLSNGNNAKVTFNIGAQYQDNLFFGINLNSHTIDYEQRTFISEINSNANSTVKLIEFENDLSVNGAGFSAQIGAIAKLTNEFRIGFTYDTPTWFVISEETTQFLETRRVVDGQSISEVVNPQVINVFEDYNLRTPGRLGASAAYVFGGQGLISFDYSYKDYSNITFSPKSDPVFSSENTLIDSALKGASTYKVGAEFRVDELSLRGGLSYEESPFTNETTLGERQGYSLGLGYNFGGYHIDVAYSRTEQSSNPSLYAIGLTDTAAVDTVYSNFLFTLGIDL
ncbi:outer membrane protein transport protein [Aureisphaera galaxeae]|uniref:OmpP1/FadL family transporter n=1 Tax=Aureisphaera galaxeae TaxID=1538023 RepID=UPI0023504CDF|nr:outer membrane protein transport protein [Aureisphaera galaxeae]MDC8005483.1 outer membrane protein transport protein [Aureisphaera galaxeae]